MPADEQTSCYILRIQRDELGRQLYAGKSLYVGIKRDWSRGTKILFVRKADAFIGSGAIDRIVDLDEMGEGERKLCLENNWYGKLLFAKLTRFRPAVPVQDTPAAGQNPLTLHGASIAGVDVSKIEALAPVRIITL